MVRRWLGYAALLLWFLLSARGLPLQLQVYALGGVAVPPVAFKAALLLVLVPSVFLAGRKIGTAWILVLWGVFATYLVGHTLYLIVRFGYPLEYVTFNYNAAFFYLLVTPLMLALGGAVSGRVVSGWLTLLFVPLAVLGILQALLNNPIVATESLDETFDVNSWQIGGGAQTRGFSLFTSGLEFGFYITLVAALAVAYLLGRRWRRMTLVDLAKMLAVVALVGLAVIAAATTFTRLTYMQLAMTVVTAYLIKRPRGNTADRLLPFLPIAYGAVSVFVIFVLAPWISTRSASVILSNSSTLMRYQLWAQALDLVLDDSIANTFFGTGLIQNDRFFVDDAITVDNAFLAVWINLGLVGLVLWLALMWGLWRYALSISRVHSNPLTVAVAASWSTWIATGAINNTSDRYTLLLLLLILGMGWEKRRGKRRRVVMRRGVESEAIGAQRPLAPHLTGR